MITKEFSDIITDKFIRFLTDVEILFIVLRVKISNSLVSCNTIVRVISLTCNKPTL